jgi:hypothetical protein
MRIERIAAGVHYAKVPAGDLCRNKREGNIAGVSKRNNLACAGCAELLRCKAKRGRRECIRGRRSSYPSQRGRLRARRP